MIWGENPYFWKHPYGEYDIRRGHEQAAFTRGHLAFIFAWLMKIEQWKKPWLYNINIGIIISHYKDPY